MGHLVKSTNRAAASLDPELSDAVALHVESASQSVITAPAGVFLVFTMGLSIILRVFLMFGQSFYWSWCTLGRGVALGRRRAPRRECFSIGHHRARRRISIFTMGLSIILRVFLFFGSSFY